MQDRLNSVEHLLENEKLARLQLEQYKASLEMNLNIAAKEARSQVMSSRIYIICRELPCYANLESHIFVSHVIISSSRILLYTRNFLAMLTLKVLSLYHMLLFDLAEHGTYGIQGTS